MNVKKLLTSFLFCLLSVVFFMSPVGAALVNDSAMGNFNNNLSTAAQGSNYDTNNTLEGVVATAVRVFLSALGTLFLFLMFLAGSDWMRAAGNDQKVRKSKDAIRNLTIGLAVVLIAFAASSFIGTLLTSVLFK